MSLAGETQAVGRNTLSPSSQDTIKEIHELIWWLHKNGESQDVSGIGIKMNALATNSFWLAEEVSRAYTTMNEAEDDYKSAVAKEIAASTLPTAKAERLAEAAHSAKKREFVEYRNLYNRLRGMIDRIDTVLDTYRQRVSLLKQELKQP